MSSNFFEDNTDEKIQKENIKRESNSLWCERYRPLALDDYIGNKLLKEKVKTYIETNDIPHLLLHGKAGGGKCLDFSECIDIEIDVSEDEQKILKKFEL